MLSDCTDTLQCNSGETSNLTRLKISSAFSKAYLYFNSYAKSSCLCLLNSNLGLNLSEAEAGSSSAGRLDVCQGTGKEMESEVNRPWETDMLTLLNFQ